MTPVYEAAALTKLYGRKTALNNVSFTVEAGRLVGLLGPNGSGKTTLLKISAGLLTPTVGLVRIAGNQPGHKGRDQLPTRPHGPADRIPGRRRRGVLSRFLP